MATDMDDKSLNLWRQINALSSRARKPMAPGADDPSPMANIPTAARPRSGSRFGPNRES
jgi:hypothetical protein